MFWAVGRACTEIRKQCALREVAMVQNVWGLRAGGQEVVTSEVGEVVGTGVRKGLVCYLRCLDFT